MEFKKVFFYDERNDSKELFDKKRKEIAEHIKARLMEYDAPTIDMYYYWTRKSDFRQKIAPKQNLNRIPIRLYQYYPLCSPVFLGEFASQVQKEMEKAVGISNLHEIPNLSIVLFPFRVHIAYSGINCFDEIENGICYTYAWCMLTLESMMLETTRDISSRKTYFWVRVHSTKNPSEPIDLNSDITSADAVFEICDTPPKTLPKIEDWPEDPAHPLVLQQYNVMIDEYKEHAFDNPGKWKEELKGWLETILEKNKKREERAARKSDPKRKKFVLEMPENLNCWPDISYELTMNEEVTDGLVEDLHLIVMNYLRNLKGESPDFYSVDKRGENRIDITVDFGMSDFKVFKGILRLLQRSGFDIEKVVIDG